MVDAKMKMTMTRILILTGAPGVGKTTVLTKIVDAMKAKGMSVGGMVSRPGGTKTLSTCLILFQYG